jgi:hypothetical protein
MKTNPALVAAMSALAARTKRVNEIERQKDECTASQQRIAQRAQEIMDDAKAGRFVSRAEVKRMKARMAEIEGRKRILSDEAERLEKKLDASGAHFLNTMAAVLNKRERQAAAARKAGRAKLAPRQESPARSMQAQPL